MKKFTTIGLVATLAFAVIVAISAFVSSKDAGSLADSPALPLESLMSRAPAAVSGDGTGIDLFEPTHPPAPAPTTPFLLSEAEGAPDIERTLADYAGKVVVLNFWAMWCAPCVHELPQLDRLRALILPEGGEVIALSLDRGGVSAVRNFFTARGIENLQVIVDKGRTLTKEAGVGGLPTTILFDRDGNEVGRLKGAAEWDSPEALALIRGYLATGN